MAPAMARSRRCAAFSISTTCSTTAFSLKIWRCRSGYSRRVCTEGPSTIAGLIKQRIRWNRGRIETIVHYTSEIFSKGSRNRLFFWFVVPLVYLSDLVAVLRVVLTLLLYIYSLEIVNYSFLYVLMAMTSFIYLLVFLSDDHERTPGNMAIIPLVYFLLHLSTLVEVYTLLTAYWTMLTRRQVGWQKLQRRGVVDHQ